VSGPAISLQFGPQVREPIRSRVEYAFRVFAAIYDHPVVLGSDRENTIRCYYGETPPAPDSQLFHIPALYREDRLEKKNSPLIRRYSGEDIYLTFGLEPSGARPDWLGEIFLWLSCTYEKNITARDYVGRIPYSEMIFSRERLSPRKPHAAQLMSWFENALQHGNAKEEFPRAPSPVSGSDHLVVCSQDIDFYYLDRWSTVIRLFKNMAAALVFYKSGSYFFDNLKMTGDLLLGKQPGEYLSALRKAGVQHDFASTFFVVPRQAHRRDPNYSLGQIASQLPGGEEIEFSVEVHGSYCSVIEDRTLAEEAQALSRFIGRKPQGNRQHWLRFADHQVLFDEIQRAELIADSTLGFSEEVGFRNGASFAFPPYNFAQEAPYNFLEVPLVLMDGGLEATSRASATSPQKIAEEVLTESRKYGWGGVSVLWHNPMEQLSVPRAVNDVFWKCIKQKDQHREKWMSLQQFLACSIERYQNAGLLIAPSVGVEERHAGI
jgi:hypothetical protein